MRVLLSTIGSRGEIQPMTALALQLRELGRQVRLCAPPDFRDLIDGHGLPFVPVGPEVRKASASRTPTASGPPSPEALRQLTKATVDGQFAAIGAAAEDCDVILGCGALQIAARSIAEQRDIPYIYAAYCPITLPSAHHAPPPLRTRGQAPADPDADERTLWDLDAQRWNDTFGAALNAQRAAAGLEPVTDVRGHIFTERPLLAADPTLGPWPTPSDLEVTQTGAWILSDQRPLSAELEKFLADGEPPIYFGFGSMHVPQESGRVMIDTARALGYRAIVSSGWAGLSPVDDEPDCLTIDEVNQQALFPRVAAVVHHGGAGTTTTTARAGTPQVIVPRLYDQYYWARRVQDLGIGVAHPAAEPTTDSLATALDRALRTEVAARAESIATAVRTDGTAVAAHYLTNQD